MRILVADDHALFRKGVKAALASRPDMELVGEASDGVEAIALARETRPDIVLMDIEMPRCDGLLAAWQIKSELPHTKIVILTVSDDAEDLFKAIKSGAQGYLVKDLKVHQLFDTLEGIARGEAFFSGVVAAKILQTLRQPAESEPLGPDIPEPLTAREIEVLQLLAEGASNKDIASELFISESTVKNHLRNIMEKLHLRNRIQMAVFAVRKGLVGDTRQME